VIEKLDLMESRKLQTDLLAEAVKDGHRFEILSKPVPPQQMLAKVASLLSQSQCARPE